MKYSTILALFLSTAAAVRLEGNGTGPPIPICNGANTGHCVEADWVVQHRVRRPHKRAGPGEVGRIEQDIADSKMAYLQLEKHH